LVQIISLCSEGWQGVVVQDSVAPKLFAAEQKSSFPVVALG